MIAVSKSNKRKELTKEHDMELQLKKSLDMQYKLIKDNESIPFAYRSKSHYDCVVKLPTKPTDGNVSSLTPMPKCKPPKSIHPKKRHVFMCERLKL